MQEDSSKIYILNDNKFMMKTDLPTYIPIANSTAGGSLTPANWQEIGINTISYSLETLLVKPGIKLLYSIPDFKNYIGWPDHIVLNASNFPPADKNGCYYLRSAYDGSLIQIKKKELIDLISHLQPDFIILPQDFSESDRFHTTTTPFIHSSHHAEFTHLALDDIKSRCSDLPAQAALEGKIYLKKQPTHSANSKSLVAPEDKLNIINLCDPAKANQHQIIDENCQCPTCASGFTQAYLHYLFFSTPLLCYRFLIQHNAYTYAYSFTKA